MKMIAAAANVAPATLFLYAADKRNLLLLIVNDELEVLTAHAFDGVDRRAPLLDQLIHLFAARYRYWGADPELSLRALQEVIVSEPGDEQLGSQFLRYQQQRDSLTANILELLQEQQRIGRLRDGQDPAELAGLCIALYLAVVGSWLRDFATPAGGIVQLRRLLEIALAGSIVKP